MSTFPSPEPAMGRRMHARDVAPCATSRQSGFTIVELMIAVALGLIVLAALTAYFVKTSANRAELERNSRQIENGRFAIDTLHEELAVAGFYADLWQPDPGTVWQAGVACATTAAAVPFVPSQLAPQIPVPIIGFAQGAGAPPCLTNYLAGTDVLVVRRFNTESTPVASADASQLYVQVSECSSDPTATPFNFGQGAPGTPVHKLNCTTPADLWRYREDVYYVRSCSICGADTTPTLVRLDLDGGAMNEEPLVEGIQDFRVEYGVDSNKDSTPDTWTRCDDPAAPCTATDWANVVAVRIYVLSRNLESSPGYADTKTYEMGMAGTVGPFNDGFKRHVYSAQIALLNRSGPREPQLP